MNVDLILSTMNQAGAEYILFGGMNFFLVHAPITTFDVDLWIQDTPANHQAVHTALTSLEAEVSFSPRGDDWQPIGRLPDATWLRRLPVFCLNSPHGAVDLFRHVPGLEEGYDRLAPRCPMRQTPSGVAFRSLADDLMIRCQLALPESTRKLDRLRALGYRPGESP